MAEDKIGTDQWVSSYQQRKAKPTGLRGFVDEWSKRLPLWAWLLLLVVISLPIPLFGDNYIIRVGGTIALMATLAIGLNVVVGYAGLLDLGFVAFYGLGAYAYAYVSSDFSGLHWPTLLSLLMVVVISAVFGLLLGSPSLRLVGDYLAIVTLGFGQIFVNLTTGMTRVNLPGLEKPINLTGGPNGIPNLDPLHLAGLEAASNTHYFFILLALLVLVLLAVHHLRNSRLGRAWRALREDELAAEAMGMPTRRLKLMAFAIGAAIAGLSGAIFAAWQGAVFPNNFDIDRLITLYAIVVLGGMGSLPGVLIGAVVMIAMPEVLRNVELAGTLFYIGVVITLLTIIKPRWRVGLLLVVVALFGILLKLILTAALPEAFVTETGTGATVLEQLVDLIRSWLILPEEARQPGNLAFFGLIILILLTSRLKHPVWHLAALVPTVYLLAFVWETRLSQEPSVTRLLFVGVLLVVLMIYRPNGLLGQRRVEVV
jgi:ABC-type branched-subunit amino acid transport system permease subunit